MRKYTGRTVPIRTAARCLSKSTQPERRMAR
nr:MAG TPA: hypothetical protein [Caudoviricetes sp.]